MIYSVPCSSISAPVHPSRAQQSFQAETTMPLASLKTASPTNLQVNSQELALLVQCPYQNFVFSDIFKRIGL